MMHSEFTDPLISPSSHESRHTGVDLANLRLEEEEVPNAVSFDTGADNPAEAKHLQVSKELARLGPRARRAGWYSLWARHWALLKLGGRLC